VELEVPPRIRKAVNEPLAQPTVGLSASRDTLTKADRLEIPYLQYKAPAQPISYLERMPPSDRTAIIPQEAPTIFDQHRRSAVVVMLPKPRPKQTASKKTANAERSKVTIEVKSCWPNTFGSLTQGVELVARMRNLDQQFFRIDEMAHANPSQLALKHIGVLTKSSRRTLTSVGPQPHRLNGSRWKP
jgi:hypothetical protein